MSRVLARVQDWGVDLRIVSNLYNGVFVDLIRRSIMEVESSPPRWKGRSLSMANRNWKARRILRRSFGKSSCRAIARDAAIFLMSLMSMVSIIVLHADGFNAVKRCCCGDR